MFDGFTTHIHGEFLKPTTLRSKTLIQCQPSWFESPIYQNCIRSQIIYSPMCGQLNKSLIKEHLGIFDVVWGLQDRPTSQTLPAYKAEG